MKISVILAFLLSWSFVSSNPHQETSNDKSVGELNHENDGGSDSSNLARTESSDEASSGKDWGGDIFFSQMDLDGTDGNHDANDKPFLFTLISKVSKMGGKFVDGGIKKIATPKLKKESDISSNGEDLSDNNNHNGNILSWIQGNMEKLGKFFANQNRETEESASVDEETETHGNRAKRDLEASSNPHKRSISEQLLKLTEGSTSNVLRSEKATVAEALNGRAIRKILEQAKAKAAKVVPHKDLYNSNDFSKWLLSGSLFDTNIFQHHPQPNHRSSLDAKVEKHTENTENTENTDDLRHREFSTLHDHAFDPSNRHRHREEEHTFNTLSDPTGVDAERSYAKLLHKSKHRERLSPKLQITSGEKRSRDETNWMFRKPTVAPWQAHGSLYYGDDTADDTDWQYYSHAYAPYMRFRIRDDEDAENDMPRWKHAKWIHRFGARAPHFADSLEFDSPEEMDDYRKRYIFRSTFDGYGNEADDEKARAEYRKAGHRIASGMDIYGINHDSLSDEETKLMMSNSRGMANWRDLLNRKRYYYDIGDQEPLIYDSEADAIAFGGTKNRRLTYSPAERASPTRREKNIRNKNKHLNGVERSAIYSTAETTGEGAAEERSGDVLTTKISTGTPTRKAVSIDIGHYHSRDRNAANTATSLSSGLSDEKGSERTNNALTSPLVDDGSAAARREAAKSGGHGVLRRTRPVIDNDAASAEIEMGFSGIKSHPRADLLWAHSSPSRERSKTHRGAQRGISGRAAASAETEHSMDSGEGAPLKRVKTQKHLPENYADYDLAGNEEVNDEAESSAEATSSVENEYQYDLSGTASSSGDSREEDYAGTRKERVNLNGARGIAGRDGTSIDMIDFPDRNGEAYILIPEFPVYKFRKGHWPYYDVNYRDPSNEEMRDNQEIRVGEFNGDWRDGEINYDGWEQEEKSSADDDTSEKSIMAISNARRSNARRIRHRKHGEYAWRNRYDRRAFNQFLRNMTWSSSIMSNITEYESWKRYIEYLYYLWKRRSGKSDASTLATEESGEQDNAMDEEISSDRRGKKHTTDEDNYVHLRKHKKWPERAGKFIIKSAPGLKRNRIKSTKINNGRTWNEKYGEGEVISEENVYNQRENHEALARTGNVIREDFTADMMSKARGSEKIIDNNRHRQQGSWNSLSLEDSYADARTKSDGYGLHRRNNIDVNQETTESANSENNLRRVSTKTSSTSQSYAESRMDEDTVNKSNDTNIVSRMQALGKANIYQDGINSGDTSVTSSESTDKSQLRTIHRLREKLETDRKQNASTEILAETIASSDKTNKSQSNVRNTVAASKVSTKLQDGSEHYLKNMKSDEKQSTNTEASAKASSMKDKKKSISENTFSKSSVQSKTEIENYSNEDTKNDHINIINSGESSASSSKSSAKSRTKTEQIMDNSKNIQIDTNTKASSTAMLSSDNTRNEWSTSSSKLSTKSQLKSDYYLTNRENSRINSISRSSADSTLSDTVEDERRSHLQGSSSSSSSYASSKKLQGKSQHDSNSIQQNNQMSVATTESSVTSTSLNNAENRHWSDSSKSSSNSLEETHQHNSNDIIKTEEGNIENQSELESASSSKSGIKSKLKDEHYSSVTEDNENNTVNADVDASSQTTSSASVKDNYREESASSLSSSRSFAESQVKNRNIKKETTMSNTISSSVIDDMKRRNLLRVLSSQITKTGGLKVQQDPRTIIKSATFETSTEIDDDKRRREDNSLEATSFIDPENHLKTSTSNAIIRKGEIAKENSNNALNAAASAVTSTNIRDTQNSMTHSSSSVDSRAETRMYSENRLKEGEAITGNSRISATSRTSSEIGDNDKSKLLKTSSVSEAHSTSAEENRRDMSTTQNSQESMAAAKTSSESTISSSNVRSRHESTLFESSEEAQQKRRNLNIRRGKSEGTASETTLMASNNVNNEHQDSALKGTSSIGTYKESQTNDKLINNKASVKDSVEMSKSAVTRNNKHERRKHISSYDYRDGESIEREINSRGSTKYSQHISDVNEMISTGSVTSAVSNNANRSNLLRKVILSDNLYAESSREDEDKSDIHSAADGNANTGIISYNDKQARGNILRKLIFLSDPSYKTRMMHGNYDILEELSTVNGNKENNLRKMLSHGVRVGNENVKSTENINDNVKDATDPTSTNTGSVNFKSDWQDDPNTISIAKVQDKYRAESTSSIDRKAQSEINRKSSVSRENEIVDTEIRDMYNINKWRTRYQTGTSSSSHAETQDKSENTLKTEVSTKSTTSKTDENSHESGSIREKSSSISSGSLNYGDHQRADMEDASKASAEASISNVSPIECQDDAKKEASAISQLKRHDWNVRNGDKEIVSDVLQSAEETKLDAMQNTQQRKLSGSVTSSNSRGTEIQHEENRDIAKEGLEVTASGATSTQTASSSEAVESESREKLMEVSSKSDSYTNSQRGSKHSSNALSRREEQIIANAKASADPAVSNKVESVRQSDWVKKDSLAEPGRDTYVENKNAVKSNLANVADATSSTEETSYGVIKDERQSGVTTTALLSNSRAETQRDCNSDVQRESIKTSSNDKKDRVLKSKNIVNMEANLKAAANAVTSADAMSSNGVSSKTLSSANSYAESQQMDNTRTQTMASNEFRNVEVDKSLRTTSSSDAYAQATGGSADVVRKDSSVVANARTGTATSTDIKGADSHGLFNLMNAAENSQETTNAKASATSLVSASVGARGKDSFMREKFNVDPQIRGMTKTRNDDNSLQEDLRDDGNAEESEQATSFSDVKNGLQEKDEYKSRVHQEQRLITVDSTASSSSETFGRADNVRKNNLEELTATSWRNSYEKSNVGSENRVNVLTKDHADVHDASKSTMISNEFRNTEGVRSLQTTSSTDANAQAMSENNNSMREDSSAVNARTETATSTDVKGTNSHRLFDLLTGAAARMRTKGEAISRGGAIKEDLSGTSSDVLSGAGVESASAKIRGGNYENSATVNEIAETGSGDQRNQQGDSRGTASSSSRIQHGQLDGVMKSTSSANSYAAQKSTGEGIVEEDPGVNLSTSGAAEAHNQVKAAYPGWLVTTSDAGTVAEGGAQNKDKFNVLREVEEVAVYAGASAGAADAGNIEGEQRDTGAKESGERQGGSNAATKIRHATAATITSMGMENQRESKSVSGNEMTASLFNEANAGARLRSERKNSVLRKLESSVDMKGMRSSSSAASSASTLDNLSMNHRAKYHQTDNGMSAIASASKGIRLSSGESTVLYPSRESSKCDENVETREFISEATSLYQMLNKQRGSEILLMKKNPRGPVQIASLKNSVPPLISYRLIPRAVYERIRAIIASRQIFCTDCALSNT